jgi:hypothetical protein
MIARLSDAVFPSSVNDLVASTSEPHPNDNDSLISHNYPKPVEILQDLQSELYGQREKSSSNQTASLDVVSLGIVSLDIAEKLLHT